MTPMESIPGIRTSSHSGFTLVELVAVILLLGILAFSVAPRFLDKGSIDVSAMAEQLASDIRYTQSLAMTSGQRNRINLAAASYQITTSAGAPVTHPATGSTTAISLGNVSLSGYNPPLTNSYIAFDGKGIPYTNVSGTVLAASATITLNSPGAAQRQIVVSPQTGRVAVQ
jgi:MSHA pilin protein MshC